MSVHYGEDKRFKTPSEFDQKVMADVVSRKKYSKEPGSSKRKKVRKNKDGGKV